MRRILIALAGLATAILVGLGMTAPANAATASPDAGTETTTTSQATAVYAWGPYWSPDHKAKVKGTWYKNGHWTNVQGKLYDYTHKHNKCAYAKFKIKLKNGHEYLREYRNCDSNHVFAFHFKYKHVKWIKVKVGSGTKNHYGPWSGWYYVKY
ncbi:hypothetical protein [Bailinhaonella thermotolerans]|uniref:hypothetical protein n=1 Tax=Bailinhaonella thermotolerans TaxID=1070861 RepID=UPI00192A2D3A|nr:hypothetical protein [Bailinhaonella thermotolerans]